MPFSKDKKEIPKKEGRNRFQDIHTNGSVHSGFTNIFKDQITGVHYLSVFRRETGIGVTPLIGSDGKIVIDPVEDD